VVVSVPGQASFTRFVKLPPVEKKKIPDIVKFEAEQQIPFPIEEVIWQYQIFEDPDSPDVEVGLFAMKRTDIQEMLSYFEQAGVEVDVVQMAPLALYNYMTFDAQAPEGEATILADVGADKTDLVVADGPRIWTRTIQIGGNNFTEALVRAFKLSFAKAEKLKRSAATSKYARQIFQSMRPVFSDLVQEIQRSVGYYTSLHRETRFKRMIGLGSGFKLPGLQKFLEQNLNMTVVRVDTVNNVRVAPEANAAAFNENVLSAAVTYGLAAQGLGLTRIQSNLLPEEIETRRRWAAKRPWFAAAAAVILLALSGMAYRAFADKRTLTNEEDMQKIQADIGSVKKIHERYEELKDQGRRQQRNLAAERDLYVYRTYWPDVENMIRRVVGVVTADGQGRPGGHQDLLARYTGDLKEKLELDKTVADQELILQGRPAPKVEEDAREKQKQAREELGKVKERIRKFLVAGAPSREAEYIDLEATIETLEQDLQKEKTDRDFEDLELKRRETQAKLDQLVAESFAKLRIFRIESIETEFAEDVTRENPQDVAARWGKGGGAADRGAGGPSGSSAGGTKAGGKSKPGFIVIVSGRTAVPDGEALKCLRDERVKAQSLSALEGSPLVNLHGMDTVAGKPPGVVGAGPVDRGGFGGPMVKEEPLKEPDPLLPRREMANDTRFMIVWLLTIERPTGKAGTDSGANGGGS
jgi:type IV pilus assembly protein PilM